MFMLSEADLSQRILGCGDGPASFNSSLSARGGKVVSFDPIYAFNAEQIRSRLDETYVKVIEQLRLNQADYVWNLISSVDELGQIRMAAMEAFLQDFEAGKREGRYVAGELPILPFTTGEFDLALSSHFLFLYSEHLSVEFHFQALQEMLRVATEVRVFPLLTLDGQPSPHLDPVCEYLSDLGFQSVVLDVPYEFQRGGYQMLRIRKA